MAAPTFDELTAGIHRLSGDMQRNRESAEGIVHSFSELMTKLFSINLGLKAWHVLTGGITSHYTFAAQSLTATSRELYAQRRDSVEHLRTLRAQLVTGEISLRQYRDARFAHAATRDVFKAQVRLARELDEVGRVYLGVAAGMLAIAKNSLETATRYNEALHEANVDVLTRLGLMQKIAQVQIATGSSQANVVNATRALVRYGMESKATFEANLKTVVMLHDAVGLSADESAHLAAVTENYAKASFQDVADVVATIVDQTALAAGEVKNLGVELQRALGVVTPGATNLPQVVMALSGYEASLKEVTGRVGSFQKMVTQLATPEGMMQAGILGVTPEMIKTKEGIDLIMSRFEGLVDRVVGNSEGLNRVWRLDTVAKMMNMSREEVSEMTRALELHRNQQITQLTLQERYDKEAANLNQGVSQLVNSLTSLMQQGLYPVVFVLSRVASALAWVLRKMLDWQGVGFVAMGVMLTTGILLWGRLKSVGRAFLEVAWAAQIATQNLRAHAVAQMAGRAGQLSLPGMGGAGGVAARGLLGGLSLLSLPLVAIAASVATIAAFAYAIYRVNKQSAEETARVNRALSERGRKLEENRREQMYLRMRYGDQEGALKQLGLLLQDASTQGAMEGKSKEEIDAIVRAKAVESVEDLQRARFTKTFFEGGTIEGTADLRNYDKEQTEILGKVAAIMGKVEIHTKTSVQHEKDNAAHMKEQYEGAHSYWLQIQRFFNTFPPADPMAGSWGNWPAMRK